MIYSGSCGCGHPERNFMSVMTSTAVKTALFAGVLASGMGIAGASADDRPAKAFAMVPYSWTGFYVGGHAAGGSTNVKDAALSWGAGNYLAPGSANAVGVEQTSHKNFNFDQAGGGIQAGYNYQFGHAVAGIEADLTLLGPGGSTAITAPYVTSPQSYTIRYAAKIDWLTTIRGRLGYAADRWLMYVTGGVTIADAHFDWSFSDTVPGYGTGSGHKVLTRPVVGGGFEYALTNNVSAKLEYLYMSLGTISAAGTIRDVPFTGFSNALTGQANLSTHLVSFGLNYKFAGAGP